MKSRRKHGVSPCLRRRDETRRDEATETTGTWPLLLAHRADLGHAEDLDPYLSPGCSLGRKSVASVRLLAPVGGVLTLQSVERAGDVTWLVVYLFGRVACRVCVSATPGFDYSLSLSFFPICSSRKNFYFFFFIFPMYTRAHTHTHFPQLDLWRNFPIRLRRAFASSTVKELRRPLDISCMRDPRLVIGHPRLRESRARRGHTLGNSRGNLEKVSLSYCRRCYLTFSGYSERNCRPACRSKAQSTNRICSHDLRDSSLNAGTATEIDFNCETFLSESAIRLTRRPNAIRSQFACLFLRKRWSAI